MATTHTGILWALLFMLLTALFVAVQSRGDWKERALQEDLRTELLLERVAADQCFLDGDHERAMALYADLASRTADSMLLQERRALAQRALAALSSASDKASGPEQATGPADHLLARYATMEAELKRARAQLDMEEQQLREAFGNPTERQEEIARIRQQLDDARRNRVLRFPSGKKGDNVIYLGEVIEGQSNGQGFGVWSSGSVYEGQWRNNLRHGRGEFNWKDGERYVGNYAEDLRDGFGTYHWKNGQRWEGTWQNDMRHGRGILYEANGKVRVQGIWENDKLVESIKNGK